MRGAARPHTPFGFYLCALCAAGFCAVAVAAHLASNVETAAADGLAVRGPAMLLATLAAVTAEALWRARPWAYRASVSLALVYAATLAANLMVLWGTDEVGPVILLFILSGFLVVPMLGYIHHRSHQLWPRTAIRIPASRP